MFTFNGSRPEDFGLEYIEEDGSSGADVELAQVFVPGRMGGWQAGRSVKSRKWTFSYGLASTEELIPGKLSLIAQWLLESEEGIFILDYCTDRFWMASFVGTIETTVTRNGYRGLRFTFEATDPLAYHMEDSDNKTLRVGDDDGTARTASNVIYVSGTAPTMPKFLVDFTGSASHITFIKSADEICTIGTPAQAGATTTNPVMQWNEDCDDISDWSTGTGHDGTTMTGTMGVNGNAFQSWNGSAEDFGTGSAWHGPSRRRSFSSVDDIEIMFECSFDNGGSLVKTIVDDWTAVASEHKLSGVGPGKMISVKSSDGKKLYKAGVDYWVRVDPITFEWYIRGGTGSHIPSNSVVKVTYQTDQGLVNKDRGRCLLYILDVGGNVLAKLGVADTTAARPNAQIIAQVGSQSLIRPANAFSYRVGSTRGGSYVLTYNNSFLRFILRRRVTGTQARWTLSIYRRNNYNQWPAIPAGIQTFPNGYVCAKGNMPAAVDVTFGKWATSNPCLMQARGIWVKTLPDSDPAKSNMEFVTGDRLYVDFGEGEVRHGRSWQDIDELTPRRDLITLDSTMFPIEPGSNTVLVRSDLANANISAIEWHTPRYW